MVRVNLPKTNIKGDNGGWKLVRIFCTNLRSPSYGVTKIANFPYFLEKTLILGVGELSIEFQKY